MPRRDGYRPGSLSTSTIDISVLPPNAQKILDPSGPAPLKAMAAKGLAPGLKPGETLAVICSLSLGTDVHSEVARKTIQALPLPLLNGALATAVQPGVLDIIGPLYAKDANLSEKILHHASILAATVAAMAMVCSEGVAELIATNEERMLAKLTRSLTDDIAPLLSADVVYGAADAQVAFERVWYGKVELTKPDFVELEIKLKKAVATASS